MWVFDSAKCVVKVNASVSYQFIADTISNNVSHQVLMIVEKDVWVGKSLSVDVLLLGTFMIEKLYYQSTKDALFQINRTSVMAYVSTSWRCMQISPKVECCSISIHIPTNNKKMGTEDRDIRLVLET